MELSWEYTVVSSCLYWLTRLDKHAPSMHIISITLSHYIQYSFVTFNVLAEATNK